MAATAEPRYLPVTGLRRCVAFAAVGRSCIGLER